MVAWHDYSLLSHRFLPILLLWLPGAIFLASFFGSIIDVIIGSSTFWGLIPNGHILVAVFVMIVFVAVLKLWWEIVDWIVGRVRG